MLTNTDDYEFHETKGYFTQKDYNKTKKACEQYDTPIVLVFACLPVKSSNAKLRTQIRRVEKIDPYMKRVIRNANKELFGKINFLMEY